jgi:hypothetical protein
MAGHRLRKRRLLLLAGVTTACLLACSLLLNPGSAQQIHRNPFETETISWVKGDADVAYVETKHVRTNQGARNGQGCEYIEVDAQQGSFINYQYPTNPAPVCEELSAGLYVKSNHPGVKLLARVVLPNERDPKSLKDCLTTLLRGDEYRPTGRWQKLEIRQPHVLAKQQQQLMQQKLGRAVNFKDAYVDMLILNIYGGPGQNQVWIDDLEIGPVLNNSPFQTANQGGATDPGAAPTAGGPTPRAATVEFSGAQLLVGGKRFFFRGIRHTDTPLDVLRNAGFNTVFLPYTTTPVMLRQASDLGFWLVPGLRSANSDKQLVSSNMFGQEVARFPELNSVLFWNLGEALATEQTTLVSRSAKLVKSADPGRPVGADVWDGFKAYSHPGNLNLVGAHRWPLMTELPLTGHRDWLMQRRNLVNSGTFVWTWIQDHMPEFYSELLYGQPSTREFQAPVGPQPEQVRLLAYIAVGSGCRGLGFWSDRFLADSHQGRDRLLCVAQINKELEMLEPLLVTADDSPVWIATSDKNVQAAVFSTAKGVLVLPMWLGQGAQYVPGQAATAKLKIIVPLVPPGTQAWEVTPGEVCALHTERVLGGTQVVLQDFGLTTAIVFTADMQLIVRFQQACREMRQKVAQWSYEQAFLELQKVAAVQRQLAQIGQALPQSDRLLAQSQERLLSAKAHWENRLFGEAYRESQLALRPVGLLMRLQWERATKALDAPVSVPFAVSYYTLPMFWSLVREIRTTSPGANVLPGGDFEVVGAQSGWSPRPVALDEVDLRAERVGQGAPPSTGAKVEAHQGKLCAMLHIEPKLKEARIGALERTYLALNSPEVHLQPGTLVQISGWIHIPAPIKASADGVLFFDSAGGEPLAIRLTDKTPWKKFTLYRRVPPSGTISVTLALSGLGTAYFDDIRIEPLTPSGQK